MSTPLAGAEWLALSETQTVIAALDAADKGESRFVGGCVRNTLMSRPVDDIDIATQLLPEEVLAALEAADIRAIPTGIEHGTITAIIGTTPFEITSLRRDVETDGRRAVVAFTRDWAEDAQRRDFRLNALYADAEGTVYDPTGGGLKDAAEGWIIFIGDADQRLREDYLRILRFFRFNAWYGRDMDAAGLAACARQVQGLQKIAAERIWKELKKLLAAPTPSRVLTPMADAGVLNQILPFEVTLLPRPEQAVNGLEALEQAYALNSDPIQRLMVILVRDAANVPQLAKALKLSNHEQDRLHAWTQVKGDLNAPVPPKDIRAEEYRLGRQAVQDWAVCATAHSVLNYFQTAPDLPVFPVKGQDLLQIGFSTGPDVGKILKKLEELWIESDFCLSKSALLEKALLTNT